MSSPLNPTADSKIKRALMLTLKTAGGVFWMLAYREAIRETKCGGAPLLPRLAISVNLAWELLYTAGGFATWRKLTIEDKTQTIINTSWLSADAVWLRELYRKGACPSWSKTLFGIGYQLPWLAFYQPSDAARRSALLQNLAFSIYCSLIQTPNGTAAETKFAIYRSIGTLIPTLTSGLLRGYQPMYMLPGIGCVLFDSLRIVRNFQVASNIR